jgi:hypothetical protein
VVLYTSEVLVEEEIEVEPTPRDELLEEPPPQSDDGAADDADAAVEGEQEASPDAAAAAPADEQAAAPEGGEGTGDGGEEGEAQEAVEEKVAAPAEPKYEKIWVSKKKVHLSYHHLPDKEDQIAYFLIRNSTEPVSRRMPCCHMARRVATRHAALQHHRTRHAASRNAVRCVAQVPVSEADDEMDRIMTRHLETGLANASSLLILEQVLTDVYLPILSTLMADAKGFQPDKVVKDEKAYVAENVGGDRSVRWRGVAWRGVAWRGVAWRGVAWHAWPVCACVACVRVGHACVRGVAWRVSVGYPMPRRRRTSSSSAAPSSRRSSSRPSRRCARACRSSRGSVRAAQDCTARGWGRPTDSLWTACAAGLGRRAIKDARHPRPGRAHQRLCRAG